MPERTRTSPLVVPATVVMPVTAAMSDGLAFAADTGVALPAATVPTVRSVRSRYLTLPSVPAAVSVLKAAVLIW